LERELRNNFSLLNQGARQLGLEILTREVAPMDMDLTIYPDARYLGKVAPRLSREKLSAACRVTGTHLHFGVGSMEEAIAVHNLIVLEIDDLLQRGDHSNGERLRLYQTVSGNGIPPFYESEEHFYTIACEKGFVNNPRDCWYFVRISCHGTVEVRVFGVTENVKEIISWAQKIHNIISYPRYNGGTILG
jgi:gamma-glutamyl:cysteine ligase YbdK (ATP-grasp superfamily)